MDNKKLVARLGVDISEAQKEIARLNKLLKDLGKDNIPNLKVNLDINNIERAVTQFKDINKQIDFIKKTLNTSLIDDSILNKTTKHFDTISKMLDRINAKYTKMNDTLTSITKKGLEGKPPKSTITQYETDTGTKTITETTKKNKKGNETKQVSVVEIDKGGTAKQRIDSLRDSWNKLELSEKRNVAVIDEYILKSKELTRQLETEGTVDRLLGKSNLQTDSFLKFKESAEKANKSVQKSFKATKEVISEASKDFQFLMQLYKTGGIRPEEFASEARKMYDNSNTFDQLKAREQRALYSEMMTVESGKQNKLESEQLKIQNQIEASMRRQVNLEIKRNEVIAKGADQDSGYIQNYNKLIELEEDFQRTKEKELKQPKEYFLSDRYKGLEKELKLKQDIASQKLSFDKDKKYSDDYYRAIIDYENQILKLEKQKHISSEKMQQQYDDEIAKIKTKIQLERETLKYTDIPVSEKRENDIIRQQRKNEENLKSFKEQYDLDSFNRNLDIYERKAQLVSNNISQKIRNSVIYGASALAQGAFYGIMYQTYQTMKDYELGLNNLRRTLTSVTDNELKDFGQTAVKYSKDFGIELNQVQSAMTELARAGVDNPNQLKDVTKTVMMGLNTTEIKDAAEMVGYLVSTMKQLNMSFEDSDSIIDGWNKLADRYAVKTNDFAEAIIKAGSASKLLGLDINDLNAMVVMLGEATQASGQEIGTALKALETRLLRPETVKTLEGYGIAVKKNAKEFLSFQEIMQNVDEHTQGLTENSIELNSIMDALGGAWRKNWIQILANDWGRFNKLVEESKTSVGYGWKENDKVMETFAKKLEQVKGAWSELFVNFSQQSGMLTTFKTIADVMSKLLSILNSLNEGLSGVLLKTLGLVLAFKSLSTVAKFFTGISPNIELRNKLLEKPLTNIYETAVAKLGQAQIAGKISAEQHAESLARLGNQMQFVAKSDVAARATQEALTAARVKAIGVNVAYTAGLVVVSMLLMGLVQLIYEQSQATEKAIEKGKQLNSEIQQNNQKYEENKKKIAGLKDEFENLSKGVNEHGDNVSLTNEEYARYKTLAEQILAISPQLKQGYDEEGKAILNKNNAIEKSVELLEREHELNIKKATDITTLRAILAQQRGEMIKAQDKMKVDLRENLGDVIDSSYRSSDTPFAGVYTLRKGELFKKALGKDFDITYTSKESNKVMEEIVKNAEKIIEASDKMTDKSQKLSKDQIARLREAQQSYYLAKAGLDDMNKSTAEQLKQVPQSVDAWKKLGSEQKNLIDSWIETNVRTNQLTQDNLPTMIAKVKDITKAFGEMGPTALTSYKKMQDGMAKENLSLKEYQANIKNFVDDFSKEIIAKPELADRLGLKNVKDATGKIDVEKLKVQIPIIFGIDTKSFDDIKKELLDMMPTDAGKDLVNNMLNSDKVDLKKLKEVHRILQDIQDGGKRQNVLEQIKKQLEDEEFLKKIRSVKGGLEEGSISGDVAYVELEKFRKQLGDNSITMQEYLDLLGAGVTVGKDFTIVTYENAKAEKDFNDIIEKQPPALKVLNELRSKMSAGKNIRQDTADLMRLYKEYDKLKGLILEFKEGKVSGEHFKSALDFQAQSEEYDALSKALDEYANNGELTLDTFQKLIQTNEEFMNIIDTENGKIVMNSNALKNNDEVLAERNKTLEEYIQKSKDAYYGTREYVDIFTGILDDLKGATALDMSESDKDEMNKSMNKLRSELKKVNNDFKSGKSSVSEYFKAIKDSIEEIDIAKSMGGNQEDIVKFFTGLSATATRSIDYLNKQLKTGQMTITEYSKNISELGSSLVPISEKANGLFEFSDQQKEGMKGFSSDITNAISKLTDLTAINDVLNSSVDAWRDNVQLGSQAYIEFANNAEQAILSVGANSNALVQELTNNNVQQASDLSEWLQQSTGNVTTFSNNVSSGTGKAITKIVNSVGGIIKTLAEGIKDFSAEINFTPKVDTKGGQKAKITSGLIDTVSGMLTGQNLMEITIPKFGFEIKGGATGTTKDMMDTMVNYATQLQNASFNFGVSNYGPPKTRGKGTVLDPDQLKKDRGGGSKGNDGYGGNASDNDKLIERDRYYRLNLEIQKYNMLISSADARQENATIREKINLMEYEIGLYQTQQENIHAINEERRRERDELAQTLSSNYGIQFDGSGDSLYATNAEAVLEHYRGIANATYANKDASESAKNNYKELEETLKRFFDLQLTEIPNTSNEWWKQYGTIKKLKDEIEQLKIKAKEYADTIKQEMIDSDENLIQSRLNRNKNAIDDTENMTKKIELYKQQNDLLKEQQDIMNKTNNIRDTQIADKITQLEKLGFVVAYNDETNDFYINNLDEMTNSTSDLTEESVKLIQEINSMNKANRDNSDSWKENNDLMEKNKQIMKDLEKEKKQKTQDTIAEFQDSQLARIENVIRQIDLAKRKDPELKRLKDDIKKKEELIQDYENKIKDLEHQKTNDPEIIRLNALIDKKREELDLLKDTNEELEWQNKLAEQQKRLDEAKGQKNIRVYYSDVGWVWEEDRQKIEEEQTKMKDLQDEYAMWKKEKDIDTLEKEKAKREKFYDDQIKSLEDFVEKERYILETSLQRPFDELNKKYDTMSENLQTALDEMKLALDISRESQTMTLQELTETWDKFGIGSTEDLKKVIEWIDTYNSKVSGMPAISIPGIDNPKPIEGTNTDWTPKPTTPTTDKTPAEYIDSVIATMKSNSQAWSSANDTDKALLKNENRRLANTLNEKYGLGLSLTEDGSWVDKYGSSFYSLGSGADIVARSEAIATSIARMKKNSELWHTASDYEKGQLADENNKLAEELNTKYGLGISKNEQGYWVNRLGNRIYARGSMGALGGLSLVGEQGAELRVLNKGDGILTAQMTRNLMDWGKMNPIEFIAKMNLMTKLPMFDYDGFGVGKSSTENNNNKTVYEFRDFVIKADSIEAFVRQIQGLVPIRG